MEKYTPAPTPSFTELMPSIKVNIAHANVVMKLEQCFDPFPALAMVCKLMADALTNKMVGPIDRDLVDKRMEFLVE